MLQKRKFDAVAPQEVEPRREWLHRLLLASKGHVEEVDGRRWHVLDWDGSILSLARQSTPSCGLTDSQIKTSNTELQELGRRVSSNMGGGKFQHKVLVLAENTADIDATSSSGLDRIDISKVLDDAREEIERLKRQVAQLEGRVRTLEAENGELVKAGQLADDVKSSAAKLQRLLDN